MAINVFPSGIFQQIQAVKTASKAPITTTVKTALSGSTTPAKTVSLTPIQTIIKAATSVPVSVVATVASALTPAPKVTPPLTGVDILSKTASGQNVLNIINTGMGGNLPPQTVPVVPFTSPKQASTTYTSTVLTPKAAVPTKILDIFGTSPFGASIGLVTDFWGMLIGSREDKTNTVAKYLPVAFDSTKKTGGTTTTTIKTLPDVMADIIDFNKGISKDNATYWDTPTIAGTDTEIPKIDIFGGLGESLKWILIGGAALIGLYIVANAFAKRK
jgi:hypothetical protein